MSRDDAAELQTAVTDYAIGPAISSCQRNRGFRVRLLYVHKQISG